MKKNRSFLLIILISSIFFSCNTKKTEKSDWNFLIEEPSIDLWRAYNGKKMPPGWKIIDGVLTFKTEQILEEDYNYKGSRDIIYGGEMFQDFELYVEWKIPV